MDTPNYSDAILAAGQRRREGISLFLILIAVYHELSPSLPSQTLSHSAMGARFIHTIESGDPGIWQSLFRMRKPCFDTLCHWLSLNSILGEKSMTGIPLRQKVMMFFLIACTGFTRRFCGIVFGRSVETIQRCFYQVLNALTQLAAQIIRMPRSRPPPHEKLISEPKFQVFSPACIGAVDGAHYACMCPAEERDVYRNRKGVTSLNVCGIVDFSGRFIYMLAGWEGSAHDQRVYDDAWKKDLTIPQGCYVLGDGGYANALRTLVPYRGVRYHLQEYARNALRPENDKELFNLRHSQLRTVVERAFGKHKAMFNVLTNAPHHSVKTHVKLIYATAAVMNFCIDFGDIEEADMSLDLLAGADELQSDEVSGSLENMEADEVTSSSNGRMHSIRDRLAREMWEDYCNVLKEREVDQEDKGN